MNKRKHIIKRRPAESGGVGAAAALLIGKVAGIDDPDTLTAIGVLAGVLPSGITWLVTTIRG